MFALSISLFLALFPLCFFRFSSILLGSSVIKKTVAIFSIEYFLCVFGPRLSFKSVQEVISSGEVSKGNVVFRVQNGVSAEIVNTF